MKRIILIAAICVYVPALGQAGMIKEVGQTLTNLGKSFEQSGRADEAIHEYSKALLVDPDNKEAKAGLSRYGMSEGLYKPLETRHSKTIHLAEQIKKFDTQISQLEQDKASIDEVATQRQESQQSMVDDHRRLKDMELSMERKLSDLELDIARGPENPDLALDINSRPNIMISEIGNKPVYAPVNREAENLKVVVEDLESRLEQAQTEADNKEVALAKLQSEMLQTIDGSLEAHQKLSDTQDKVVGYMDSQLNQQATSAGVPLADYQKLKLDLMDAQDRVSEQNSQLNEQYEHYNALQDDLTEADDQVDRLLK